MPGLAGTAAPAARLLPGSRGRTNLPTAAVAVPDLAKALHVRLAEAQAELGRVMVAMGSSAELPAGATPAEAIESRSMLQRLVRTYQLHLDDLAALDAAQQRRAELDRTVQAWTGVADPPPYSVLLVDELRDSIQSLNERLRAVELTREVVETFLTGAQTAMEESEERLRRLEEQAESAKDPAVLPRLSWQRRLEQLRGRGAAATVASFETKRQMVAGELAEVQQRLAFAAQQLAQVAPAVRFSQADLDKILAQLDAEQRRLEQEIQAAEATADARQTAANQAREALQQALRGPAAGRAELAAVARLQAVVDVRDLERQTSLQTLSVLRQLVEGVGTERQTWQTRFALAASPSAGDLQAARARLARLRGLGDTVKPYYRQQVDLAAIQLSEEEKRLTNQDGDPEAAALTRQRIAVFGQREALYRRALQSLEQRGRALARWEEALEFERTTLSWTERGRAVFGQVRMLVAAIWTFEVFAVEDTITVDGQPITGRRGVTVGKLATAILILVVGYWLSDRMAGVLERLARQRLRVEPNQANLIRRWARVALVLALIVFSLVSVKIPLTIFAFAGGALAIGVGFGTQNLLKNFISGIVILFERPFRVGDVLAVGGHTGLVTSIGIRSSVIQLWDGTEALIPNSALLEDNLTNWTYSNRTVRFAVSIGIAYGADTRRAAQLLAEAAERHGQVEKEPRPQVLFLDFGDNALTFELRYWVQVLKYNSAQVGSDLRHMINGLFAAEGIAIAFPQRDVHLKAGGPVAVELVRRAPAVRTGPATDPGAKAAEPAPAGAGPAAGNPGTGR